MINEDMAAFPKEAAILGRLLTGYGEIELSLCLCAVQAGVQFDTALKSMFGQRSAKARLDQGARLARPMFKRLGLEAEFSQTISNAQCCLKIRNRYAHSHWLRMGDGSLAIVNLEQAAQLPEEVQNLRFLEPVPLSLDTLQQQEAFFTYVRKFFDWLNMEAQRKVAGSSIPSRPGPRKAIPPLPPSRSTAHCRRDPH